MLKVGIAGMGFMGWIHWLAYQNNPNTEVVALATRDPLKRAGDWTGIKGNFGPPGEQVDLSSIRTYESTDAMLNASELDLLDVCLPPHLHTPVCLAGLEAGCHVFCEKPLALNSSECRQLVEFAGKVPQQLLVGQVLPFFPEYKFARELIDGRQFGKLLGGRFKRIVSDPTWIDDFYNPNTVGGPLIDLHVHDAHLIRMLFGMPCEIDSVARFRNFEHGSDEQVVQFCDSIFRFAERDLVVSSSSGTIDQQGRPFHHAFEVHLESATLHFEFAAFADQAESMPLKLLKPDGLVERPELAGGSDIAGFEAEIAEVVHSIRSNKPSPILDASLAADAIRMCELQAQSAKSRKPIQVNG